MVVFVNNFSDQSNSISFWDYKINYNGFLGMGDFGTVYEVVKRPENEKGYCSYLCPYVYDYIFPVKEKNEDQDTNLCVKISKSSLRVFFEALDRLAPIAKAFGCFLQSSEEKETNAILKKHNLTKINFYDSFSVYSQFKTKVNGRAFGSYVNDGSFKAPDQYRLRKSFVKFLKVFVNQKIHFFDLHRRNIMYDAKEHRWEIVDGYIFENENVNLNKDEMLISLLGISNLRVLSDKLVSGVFLGIYSVVKNDEPYKEAQDQFILMGANQG